jgi:hypothetical protein
MKFNNKNKAKRGGNGKNAYNDRALLSFTRQAKSTKLAPVYGVSELNQPYMRAFKIESPVYTNTATNNYTFTSGADTRFQSISSLLAASPAFTNYLTFAFQYFTLIGVTLEYLPINTNVDQVLTTFLAPLIANLNDNIATPANPTNSILASINSVLIHPMTKLTRTLKQFASPVNIFSTWNSVFNNKYNNGSVPTGGQVELGEQNASVLPTTPQNIGILNIFIHVVFEGPIR